MSGKINEKNVYKIDMNFTKYLFDKYSKENAKVNFQKAAMEIEASTKIWGYKVILHLSNFSIFFPSIF